MQTPCHDNSFQKLDGRLHDETIRLNVSKADPTTPTLYKTLSGTAPLSVRDKGLM